MSWHLTGIVSRKRAGSQSRKLLLLSMADKANDDGTGVYASFQTLADMCESSRATVKRLVKQFEDEGLITHVGLRGQKNGAQTNEYDINLEALAALPDIDNQQKTRVTTNRVQATPGSHSSSTRVTMTPKPIQEPIQASQQKAASQVPDAKQKTGRVRIAADAEFSEEFRAVALDYGFMNGTATAIFRHFATWMDEHRIRSANWPKKFSDWCDRERTPQRDEHDERTDEGRGRGRAARQDRSGVAGHADPVGYPRRARSRAEAALRIRDEVAARDRDHGSADERAEAEGAVLIAHVIG